MKTILEQYFIEFGQLDLLSFGCLKWQKKEATFIESGLEPPKEFILFEPIASIPSKHFYIYIADALSISIEQASIQYEHFIQNLFDGHQDRIELESLGYFTFNNGILNWNSLFSSQTFYTPIHFEKLTVKETLDQIDESEKENWILFASIIAILSLLAILFKFYH